MNSKKVYFGMIGALVLCGGLIIAIVFLGSNMLQQKGNQLLDKKLENVALDKQQETLQKAKEDIKKYAAEETLANTIVPRQKDQAQTILEIVAIANRTNVQLSSISFPSSNLGQAVPKPAATNKTEEGEAAQAAPATPAAPTETQVKVVDGIKGVYQLEVTIQSDTSKPVKYTDMLNFLIELERSRAIGQIGTINVQPTPANRSFVTFSLTINVYIKP